MALPAMLVGVGLESKLMSHFHVLKIFPAGVVMSFVAGVHC